MIVVKRVQWFHIDLIIIHFRGNFEFQIIMMYNSFKVSANVLELFKTFKYNFL